MPDAYPLAWPLGRPRTPDHERQPARFSSGGRPVSIAVGRKRLLKELDTYTRPGHEWRVPPGSIVISTNVRTYMRGGQEVPYSDQSQARDDPAAAVYFELDGQAICLPCDAWDTVGGNLAAIAAHVAALRGIERWGVGTVADHYRGFLALPEAGQGSGRGWWEVLGVTREAAGDQLKKAYRMKLRQVHPDLPGGSRAAYDEVQAAWEQAKAARGI